MSITKRADTEELGEIVMWEKRKEDQLLIHFMAFTFMVSNLVVASLLQPVKR